MKSPNKPKEKKDRIKKHVIAKPKKEQVLVVAQEIKFARLLSGNEKKGRDKVLKTLKKWLLNCFEKKYEFKEDDFVRMWKGLFYAVWMSDKPLIQEELCENISAVLDQFPEEQTKHALLMFKAGLRVLATEWYGIDHHRMDKFLMLVRRYIRASLRCLLRSNWELNNCQLYATMISGSDGIFAVKTPRFVRNATSMLLHFIDCYLEEIAKVSSGEIPPASLAALIRPFCHYMCSGENPSVCVSSRRLLTSLVRQSQRGIEYMHKTDAWKRMGCPSGGPEALELVSDEEGGEETGDDNGDVSDEDNDESSEKPLDPRAGRVDVELPLLPVPASMLADMLRDMLAYTNSKAQKRARLCLQRLELLSRDEYPLPIPSDMTEREQTPAVKPSKSAKALRDMEKQLLNASDELALRGLSRKHKKRLLAKSRSGMSIVDDVDIVKQKISNATNGTWQVEETAPEPEKPKQDKYKEQQHDSNKKRKHDDKDSSTQKRHHDAKDSSTQKRHHDAKDSSTQKRHHDAKDSSTQKRQHDAKDSTTQKRQKLEAKDSSTQEKRKLDKRSEEKQHKVSQERNDSKKLKKKLVIDIKFTKESYSDGDAQEKRPDSRPKDKNRLEIRINGKSRKPVEKTISKEKIDKITTKNVKNPVVLVNKVKNFQKHTKNDVSPNKSFDTPKKVKFALKNNSMQAPVDYYKSIRQSPSIPFDGTKKPTKTNLKPSTPSPINPFFKKKLRNKF